MESMQGHLLVASPALLDPNFRKTVVLIVRHDPQEGALGLVLNRRTSASMHELWQRISQEPCTCQEPLYLGGPCEGPLMALHTQAKLAEIEIRPGLYFCAGSEPLKELVAQAERPVKFFFGYAGWGAGQLEMELEGGAWRTGPAGAKHVFEMDGDQWQRATSEAAGWEVLSALKIREVPQDPSVN